MPGRSRAGPRHALEAKDEIEVRLAGRRAGLLIDYDGTLTPIVGDPEAAVLAGDMRVVLKALARRVPVAIISGRDLEDVTRLIGIKNLAYAGSHGFDMRLPGGRRVEHHRGGEFLPALNAAEAELRECQQTLTGLRIERKKFAIAAHYRRARDSELPAIEAAVDDVVRRHQELRKSGGKKVFELRPALDWHKGSAVLWLLDELGLRDGVSLYVGDDETDEDAFESLRERGITIAVQDADRPTAAQYYLEDTVEVQLFLEWLAAVIA